jgi:aspartate carbamoyltransferase catalytic subunit
MIRLGGKIVVSVNQITSSIAKGESLAYCCPLFLS